MKYNGEERKRKKEVVYTENTTTLTEQINASQCK